MIIEALLNVVYSIFSVLLSPFDIDGFETGTIETFQEVLDTMFDTTENFINLILPWNVVHYGLQIVLAVIAFTDLYHVTMWILRKIPMLGIS